MLLLAGGATGISAGEVLRPARLSVHWSGISLGQALRRLEQEGGLHLLVDRRVDPTRKVEFTATGEAAEAILPAVAAQLDLGTSRLGSVRYVGPAASAAALATRARLRRQEMTSLTAADRQFFLEKVRLRWERLSEPRALVVDLAQQRGWSLRNPERIPHDLWDAEELPALPRTDALTLLLAGFDLAFEVQPRQRSVVLVEAAASPRLQRQYAWPASRATTMKELRQQLPEVELRRAGQRLTATGRWEDHRHLESLLGERTDEEGQKGRRGAPREIREVYTLRVEEQPVGPLLEQLAERLGFQLRWDKEALRKAGRSLDERVTFAVRRADLDALLTAALEGTGLRHQRRNREVTILP